MVQGLFLSLIILATTVGTVSAEIETRTDNGIQDRRLAPIVLTNGTIVLDAETEVVDQNLLIKDGKVEQLSKELPAGYRVIDLKGGYVYPGLVDFYSHYGMPEVGAKAGSRWSGPETLHSTSATATNANEAIKSHLQAAKLFELDQDMAEQYRNKGFTAVLTAQPDGIARGTSAVVSTGNGLPNEVMLADGVATHYSFDKGSSKQFYPVSRMGVVSLLRQTAMDAEWFANQSPRPFADLSLEAYAQDDALPKVMSAFDWKTVLLADKVGDDLGHQFIIRGGGDEYQRLEEVKATDATIIVGVNFPATPDVADPIMSDYVTLRQLKHWELAPYNLGRMEEANIPFVITADGSEDKFWPNLKKAVANGLSESAALKALTETPAELMSLEDRIGSLRGGYQADFIVTDGPLFAKDSRILATWIKGRKYQVAAPAQLDTGAYQLSVDGGEGIAFEVKRKGEKFEASVPNKEHAIKLDVKDDYLSLLLTQNEQTTRASVWLLGAEWKGTGQNASGKAVSVVLTKLNQDSQNADEDETDTHAPGSVVFPFVGHGLNEHPEQETLLIKNATVWTNESAGVLKNTDVLVRKGKIVEVGTDLTARSARVIDATGKHVTAGIIDEHSHIALDGVNDFAVNSSMVRMEDVVDSEDVGIYRALAGGVTAAQLLHGSANPIGGQSALIKMRWGKTPQELLIEDADKFIKFALGENVKRASNKDSVRYPQTRMGVEQVYVDAFNEARLYEARWQAYEDLPRRQQTGANKPRRDLRMDAMVEILNGERFVTSHSYVQSEINMLMQVAEQFDFRINTFTHILEGYKVADKMAAHGVGGSTFSDWWTYKWEVRYAIPYNAALMHEAGVVTAINSDDAEMLRRLNQEAAKSIRHGGMSEEEALKMVTLNPAKLLHLDDRMGSVKAGKEADLVIWDGNPLSVYSKAMTTLVDGIVYFDREQHAKLQADMKRERSRLIQKALASGNKKGEGKAPPEPSRLYYSHDVLHMMMDQAAGSIIDLEALRK